MSQPLAETFTEQFYNWEQRGRGWQVYRKPVSLEPPFRPFVFLPLFGSVPTHDDGRKPSFLERVFSPKQPPPSTPSLDPELVKYLTETPEPILDNSPYDCVELVLNLPSELPAKQKSAEQFLLALSGARYALSFEILAISGHIRIQIACRIEDESLVTQQIAAFFPSVGILHDQPSFIELLEHYGNEYSHVVDFGLSHESMLPIRLHRDLESDPMMGLLGPITALGSEEFAFIQILFQPVENPWAESLAHAVTFDDGTPVFANEPDFISLTRKKISRPLFATCVRLGAATQTQNRLFQLLRGMTGSLDQFSYPLGNEFIPLDDSTYNPSQHWMDVLDRKSCRTGMLINSLELCSLVHLPDDSVQLDALHRTRTATHLAPPICHGYKLILGDNIHRGQTVEVSLSADHRTRHCYVLGGSGTGKSTLLLNMMIQDIHAGNGFAVLDPHGDLVDRLLENIPKDRLQDVVLFDPADEQFPIAFNFLQANSELEKTLLSSDLVSVFKRLSSAWGDQMNSVLANAILAFLESSKGGTLSDMRRFLIEPAFRAQFLSTVNDPEILYFWQREFPLLRGNPQAPLLTRLDTFLRPKLIRHLVCQPGNKLDFARMMDSGKIFLGKLAQGAIGEENSYLLGTMLVAKIHQAALSRQQTSALFRRHFYLYIDEFHNFVTPSMAQILSGVRKFHLGLVLAHQELRQLGRDSEVAASVLSNPFTRICFRLGDADAAKLASGFAHFESADLQSLSIGQAIARVERADYDFNLATPPLPDVHADLAEQRRLAVLTLSRREYGTPLAEVEAHLSESWKQVPPPVAKTKETHEPKPKPEKAPTPAPTPSPEVPIKEESLNLAKSQPETSLPPSQPKQHHFEPKPPETTSESTTETPDPRIPSPETGESTPKPRPIPPPTLPGRGGQEHKYLQNLIIRWAHGMGWKADIEAPVLDGSGMVDIALEREGVRIACEITVTTTADHEIENLDKCLRAGFTHVAAIASDPKRLRKIEQLATKNFSQKDRAKLHFFAPDDLFAFIETLQAKMENKQVTVRGYAVNVSYQPTNAAMKESRKEAIANVFLNRVKKSLKPTDKQGG